MKNSREAVVQDVFLPLRYPVVNRIDLSETHIRPERRGEVKHLQSPYKIRGLHFDTVRHSTRYPRHGDGPNHCTFQGMTYVTVDVGSGIHPKNESASVVVSGTHAILGFLSVESRSIRRRPPWWCEASPPPYFDKNCLGLIFLTLFPHGIKCAPVFFLFLSLCLYSPRYRGTPPGPRAQRGACVCHSPTVDPGLVDPFRSR